MRGAASLLFIGLFLLFLLLKALGKAARAGAAALEGDLPRFISALSSEEGQKIRAARTFVASRLAATSHAGAWDRSTQAHQDLGYAFAWAAGLWSDEEPKTRTKRARGFLQALFAESAADLWLLSGLLLDARSEAFEKGVRQGTLDFAQMRGF